MSRAIRLGFSIVVVLAGVGVAFRAAADDPPEPIELAPLDQLQRERVEAARSFVEETRTAYDKDTITYDLVILAIRELLDAELDAAVTPKEREAARARCAIAAGALETKVKRLYEEGMRGGEADKYGFTRTVLLQAQIELALEKDAAAKDSPEVEGLRKERLAAARSFAEAARAAYDTDTVTLDLFEQSYRELWKALLDAALTPAERLVTYKSVVDGTRNIETKLIALNAAGARGGEQDKLEMAKVARLAAEINLARTSLEADDDRAALDKLLSERVIAAQAFVAATCAVARNDAITLDILLFADCELLNAKLDAARNRADRIAAYEQMVWVARSFETKIRLLNKAGARGGEGDKVAHTRVVRLRAEVGLARARLARDTD